MDAATKRVGLTLRPHLLNRAPGQAIDLKLDPEFGGTGGGSGTRRIDIDQARGGV